MYICICNQVTDEHIRNEMCNGAGTVKELGERLGVARECGKCGQCARKLIDEHYQTRVFPQTATAVVI